VSYEAAFPAKPLPAGPADAEPSYRHGTDHSHGELEFRQVVQGRRPGEQYVGIARHKGFKRLGHGLLVPRPEVSCTRSPVGLARWLVFGSPIPTAREIHERLTRVKALAVFSSDALSSVAYATEEIMKVLVLGGLGLLTLTLPISLSTVALLAIVGSHWWEYLLHKHTALRLKAVLLFHPGNVVTNVPYHLARRAAR
jgi:hypothetical protein